MSIESLSVKLFLVATFALATATAVSAQNEQTDLIVREVCIERTSRDSSEKIANAMRLRAGEPFTLRALLDDLRNINKLGLFEEDELAVHPKLVSGCVNLTVTAKEKPVVTGLVFTGNKTLSGASLRMALSSQIGTPVSKTQMTEACRMILKRYSDEGFSAVNIDSASYSPSGIASFDISEGLAESVSFKGFTDFQLNILRRRISQKVGQPINSKKLHGELRELMNEAVIGYIRTHLAPVQGDRKCWSVTISADKRNTAVWDAIYGGGYSHSPPLFQDNFRGKGRLLSFGGIPRYEHTAIPARAKIEELVVMPDKTVQLVSYIASDGTLFARDLGLAADDCQLIERTVRLKSEIVQFRLPTKVKPICFDGGIFSDDRHANYIVGSNSIAKTLPAYTPELIPDHKPELAKWQKIDVSLLNPLQVESVLWGERRKLKIPGGLNGRLSLKYSSLGTSNVFLKGGILSNREGVQKFVVPWNTLALFSKNEFPVVRTVLHNSSFWSIRTEYGSNNKFSLRESL